MTRLRYFPPALRFVDGFDWSAVRWNTETNATACSLCRCPFEADDVRLLMLARDDRCATFCVVCVEQWCELRE